MLPGLEIKQPYLPLPSLPVDIILMLVLAIDIKEIQRLIDLLRRQLIHQTHPVPPGNLRLPSLVNLLAVNINPPDPVVLPKVLKQ